MTETAFIGWAPVVWSVAVSFGLLAGVVRGITGFGYPLIVIGALNPVAPLVEVVPVALLVDLTLGFGLLAGVRRQVDWKSAARIAIGAVIGIPVGVALLTGLDPDALRFAFSVAILISAVLIWRGFRLPRIPGPGLLVASGGVAGVMGGAGGIPGPPIILMYLSAPVPVATARATMIAFLMLFDIAALSMMTHQGLLDRETLWRAAMMVPVSYIGIRLGIRLYRITAPERVKKGALALLTLLAIVGIAKVLIM